MNIFEDYSIFSQQYYLKQILPCIISSINTSSIFNNIFQKEDSNKYLMVRVKDFCGAVFSPSDYQNILHSNIEHLQNVPMSKSFNTSQMIASGRLCQEIEDYFYIYRQHYKNHTSFGILAQISIEDYDQNKIKKHEKTLCRPSLNHSTYMQQHVGPVVVGHHQYAKLNQLIYELSEQSEPFSRWLTIDGRSHTLWKISKHQAEISSYFSEIDALYILDGHHRLQAAHQNYLIKDSKTQSDLWIQALIYSTQHIVIHPQHRVLINTPQQNQIVNQLMQMEHLELTQISYQQIQEFNIRQQLEKFQIVVKIKEKIIGVNFKNISRNVLEKVPAFRLQNEIFHCFEDDKIAKEVKYIPGIIAEENILQQDVVFFVRNPSIQTLFQIADECIAMPPKSTWIEPKPCSHMVVRIRS